MAKHGLNITCASTTHPLPIDDKPYSLYNRGNYCFLNAGVQSIFSCEEFIKKFRRCQYPKGTILREVSKLIDGLKNTDSLINNLRKIKPSLFTGEQQDSFEFTIFLLQTINNELTKMGNTLVSDLFGAEIRISMICEKCREEDIFGVGSRTTVFSLRPEEILSNLSRTVNNFFKIKRKLRYCDICEKMEMSQMQTLFENAPRFLIVYLNRFTRSSVKNDTKIKILQELELPDYASISGSSLHYRLVSYVEHFGHTIHSGHYIATVRRENRWFTCNDDKCSKASNPDGKASSTVSFLIFERNRSEG